MEIHGFYINEDDKTLRYDVVVSFEEKNLSDLYAKVQDITSEIFPEYDAEIVLDSDYALA